MSSITQNIFVYTVKGEYIGRFDYSSFCDLVQNSFDHIDNSDAIVVREAKVKKAMLGDKGYGFAYGVFVAPRKVSIMSTEEQLKFSNELLEMRYNSIRKYLKSTKEWCEDTFQEVILYVYDKIQEERGVNHIEDTVKYKYFKTLIDNGRKRIKAALNPFIVSDFDVVDDDSNAVSYIQTFAMESATQDGIEDACLHQVNELKLAEISKEQLYTNFKQKDVDLYLDYIENFKAVRKKGEMSGLRGAANKHNVSVSTVKNKVKAMTEFLKNKKDDILDEYFTVFYPDIDNLTLQHIIDESK